MQHIVVILCRRIRTRVKKSWISRPLKMGLMGCPEMLLRNYHSRLHNIPEEHKSYHHHVIIVVFFVCLENTIKYVFFTLFVFYNLMLTVCNNSNPFSTLSVFIKVSLCSDQCHVFVVSFTTPL